MVVSLKGYTGPHKEMLQEVVTTPLEVQVHSAQCTMVTTTCCSVYVLYESIELCHFTEGYSTFTFKQSLQLS